MEHQIADRQDALDRLKIEQEASLRAHRDKSAREYNSVTAELKMMKAQLREAQSQRAQAETGLASVQDRSQELERFASEALRIASAFRDSDERLMETIRSSASLSASLSIKPAASPYLGRLDLTASSSILDSTSATSLLAALAGYDRATFEEAMLKTIKLVRKWQKQYAETRDRGKDKVSIGNFQPGDVALFLPTRNFTAAVRPWAAFNGAINSLFRVLLQR